MREENKDYTAYRESEEYQRLKYIRRQKRRKQVMIARICVFGGGALFLLAIILLIYNFVIAPNKESKPVSGDESNILKEEEVKYFVIQERPVIDVQLLTPNEYSRPGSKILKVAFCRAVLCDLFLKILKIYCFFKKYLI